jgi:hypothetical protein
MSFGKTWMVSTTAEHAARASTTGPPQAGACIVNCLNSSLQAVLHKGYCMLVFHLMSTIELASWL